MLCASGRMKEALFLLEQGAPVELANGSSAAFQLFSSQCQRKTSSKNSVVEDDLTRLCALLLPAADLEKEPLLWAICSSAFKPSVTSTTVTLRYPRALNDSHPALQMAEIAIQVTVP